MTALEFQDLEDILSDGQKLDALTDCLRLLREIRWVSRDEKSATWHALPSHLRQWLQGQNSPIKHS